MTAYYNSPRRLVPKAWKRFWCRLVGHEWGLYRDGFEQKFRDKCARCGELKP